MAEVTIVFRDHPGGLAILSSPRADKVLNAKPEGMTPAIRFAKVALATVKRMADMERKGVIQVPHVEVLM